MSVVELARGDAAFGRALPRLGLERRELLGAGLATATLLPSLGNAAGDSTGQAPAES